MYIDTENILPTAAMLLVWYIVLAVPSGVWVLILTLHGKRIGKVHPDVDTQKMVIEAMVKFPKIYYLTLLGLLRIAVDFLWRNANEEQPDAQAEAKAFGALFKHRLNVNEELADYIGYDSNNDSEKITLKVDQLSGTTYMALHSNPDFLSTIRESDGSYDEESMERFRSLEPWMVFDLVCAHPHYKELLPPEIISQISIRH
jgi:hypothetical protein